jgi:hypothetical protein
VTYKATERQPERRYYQCHGKDPILSAREHKCTQRPAMPAVEEVGQPRSE